MTKELLVYIPAGMQCVMILVPKRRGEGFLAAPFGHHNNPALSNVAYEIGYDLFGLEGHLEVDTGSLYREADKAGGMDKFLERIMTPISLHYGMPWRQVGEEFWDLHPVKR